MQKTQHLLSSFQSSFLEGHFRFYSMQDCRLKDLSGYVSGSHFIPKVFTSSVEKFISKISEEEIVDHLEKTGVALRNTLELKSIDFESSVEDGVGIFECSLLKYEYCAKPDKEDLSKVVFFSTLTPMDWTPFVQRFPEILSQIYPAPDKGIVEFDKPLNIPQCIHLLEVHGHDNISNFQYDTQKNNIHASLISPALLMQISENDVEFHFNNNTSLLEFLELI